MVSVFHFYFSFYQHAVDIFPQDDFFTVIIAELNKMNPNKASNPQIWLLEPFLIN